MGHRYDAVDVALVRALRIDSREHLLTLTRRTGLPKSTLHDRLRRLIKNGLHTTVILNWELLGLPFVACFYVPRNDAVLSSPYINTVILLAPDLMFLECVFPTLREMELFAEQFPKTKPLLIVDTLKREGFFPREEPSS